MVALSSLLSAAVISLAVHFCWKRVNNDFLRFTPICVAHLNGCFEMIICCLWFIDTDWAWMHRFVLLFMNLNNLFGRTFVVVVAPFSSLLFHLYLWDFYWLHLFHFTFLCWIYADKLGGFTVFLVIIHFFRFSIRHIHSFFPSSIHTI